uniref:Uncharacterized protein n=1 Tax=Oryza rufipogon TaxID=4529 RepID=A0A0E0NTH3_ORYRU
MKQGIVERSIIGITSCGVEHLSHDKLYHKASSKTNQLWWSKILRPAVSSLQNPKPQMPRKHCAPY